MTYYDDMSLGDVIRDEGDYREPDVPTCPRCGERVKMITTEDRHPYGSTYATEYHLEIELECECELTDEEWDELYEDAS